MAAQAQADDEELAEEAEAEVGLGHPRQPP